MEEVKAAWNKFVANKKWVTLAVIAVVAIVIIAL